MKYKTKSSDQIIDDFLVRDITKLNAKADVENYEEMVEQNSKEVSDLKAKMNEQGAKILLHKEDSFMPSYELPSMHKSGALKKATTSQRLNPLKGPKSSYSNYDSSDDRNASFTPTKSSTIPQRDSRDKMISISSYTDRRNYNKTPSYGYSYKGK